MAAPFFDGPDKAQNVDDAIDFARKSNRAVFYLHPSGVASVADPKDIEAFSRGNGLNAKLWESVAVPDLAVAAPSRPYDPEHPEIPS